MRALQYFVLVFMVSAVGCHRQQRAIPTNPDSSPASTSPVIEHGNGYAKMALLLTRFKTLDELKTVIQIEYFGKNSDSDSVMHRTSEVRLTHRSCGREVISSLHQGISENDFLLAGNGNFWDRAYLCLRSPYVLMNGNDLIRIEILGRRRGAMFGEGDMAFYDMAETMVNNITDEDFIHMLSEDLSEKGYLNTFNHIIAQAFMTSIFSESLADFVADVHERYRMPELITGSFTEDQLSNLDDGPVDNYIDIVNNEWGQELGKLLREKYQITRKTKWSPELLANYLNDIQNYHSWAFHIGFKPFRTTDELIIRYANKINIVMEEISRLKKFYM
ncbi:MAG TPA: hypothetical protein VI603_08985 [Saprospiraceae bacterium]|nr:hypothetical protein [Saprospiraceae bacterium]